jgi:hypothetical protein
MEGIGERGLNFSLARFIIFRNLGIRKLRTVIIIIIIIIIIITKL